jgi:hypothetical protein
MSALFWELICHVEVAVRNSISSRLSDAQPEVASNPHWLLDFALPFYRANPKLVRHAKEAIRRVRVNRKEVTGEQVISELSFGFWCHLISKQNRAVWPSLAGSFKGLPSRNQAQVSKLMFEVRDLRNRIGHHHRIYHLDLKQKHENLMLLAHYVDPEFGMWLRSKSRVDELLLLRPQASPTLQTLQPTPPKP